MEPGEAADISAILPRRLNEPVIVFSGCTLKELITMSVSIFIFWLVFGFVVGVIIGKVMLLVLSSILLTLGSVFAAAALVLTIKKGRPNGYFEQIISLFLERFGLKKSYLFQASGQLEIGRTKQYVNPVHMISDKQTIS